MALDTFSTNLPLQLTSFIGRQQELAQIKHLLGTTRLLTLTGSGGAGKTRLALQAAADLLDETSAAPRHGERESNRQDENSERAFPDGVWLVELAPLFDPSLVPQTVASVFDVHATENPRLTEVLANHLRSKQLLLLLDNCEHLIEACAMLTDSLLRTCPQVKILATSREALNIAGEITFRVPSLAAPDPQHLPPFETLAQFEAIRLFVERASAARPGFLLTNANAPSIAQICYRLDGMPLAIELTAARVRSLGVEQIAVRLDDRFRLLTGGSRTALPRQQTLRATMDWSYELLFQSERILFRRLSVFAGGFTLEAVEKICSDEPFTPPEILDLLARLVDRSLVNVDQQPEYERYRMLESVREYAEDKLAESGEEERVRGRHVEFFLQLAEEAEPYLLRAEQLTWLARLDLERDNFRAALGWSRTDGGNAELGLRLAGALGEFWDIRGYFHEGREHLSAALDRPGAFERTAARAKALFGAGRLAFEQGDFLAARALLETSQSIYREVGPATVDLANVLRMLGYTATETGDYGIALDLIEEARNMMRESQDVGGIVRTTRELGWFRLRTGDYEEAGKYLEDALHMVDQVGDRYERLNALSGLAEVRLRQGDIEQASQLEEEVLEQSRELRDRWRVAASLGNLARIAVRRDDLKRALNLLGESLVQRQEFGDKAGCAWCLEGFAEVALLQGQRESRPRREEEFRRAARLFGAAAALRASVGSVIDFADRSEYERHRAFVRAQLDSSSDPVQPGAFQVAWDEGQAMSLKQAVECALEASVPSEEPALPAKPVSPRQAPKQDFGGLTQREREIAVLIARGKSNRVIAQQLVVSDRTVESHVANIMSKLNLSSRTQIAMWAVEKGLANSGNES